jgi:CubicO group peptidase (beta-lactamase class C family)
MVLCLLVFALACGDDAVSDGELAADAGDAGTAADAGSDAGDDAGDDAGQDGGAYDFTAFDEALEQFVSESELAGAAAVVVHAEDGIVHARGYGEHDVERVYLIASSSKVLSAGVLMRLADEGALDLDAPISEVLSDWGEHKTDITVAQLLSNSSGLVGLIDDPTYAPYLCQYIPSGTLSECAQEVYTADDEADRVPPDTQFRYGGGAWQLAGGIAEVVSGKTWSELIDETYVQPCDTPSLGYTNHYSKSFSGSLSNLGYPDFFMGDVADLPVTDNPNIEGGGYANVLDYGKLLLMHLRSGLCGEERVLSEDAVARMQEDRLAEFGGSNLSGGGYGFGWWVDRMQEGVVSDPGAYGALPFLDVPRGYGVMILVESNGMGGSLMTTIKPILDSLFEARARASGR